MNGGIVRIHAFVKYLPHFGYQPAVLTLDERWYGPAGRDPGLLGQYPPGTVIVRTPSLMPAGPLAQAIRADIVGARRKPLPGSARLKHVLRAAYRLVVIPEESILWLPHAVRAARALAARQRPVLILATTPPHGTGLIAAWLSRALRLPLVLDVRDDWIGNPFYEPHGWLRRWLDPRLEAFVYSTAARVIAVTEESRCLMLKKYPQRDPSFCRVITNGFDPGDLAALRVPPELARVPPRSAGRVRVVYAGQLTTKRSPLGFFRALRQMLDDDASLPDRLEVYIAGPVRREFEAALTDLGLSAMVKLIGDRPHAEALQLIGSADVGLVIIPRGEGGETAVPGKIYEYLVAGLFVLTLADADSAVARLVRHFGAGEVVLQDDPAQIAAALRHVLALAAEGRLRPAIDPAALQRYNRQEHARRLAAILDEVLAETMGA